MWVVELWIAAQPVARNVDLHLLDSLMDGLRNGIPIHVRLQRTEHGVAHEHLRGDRIQDDDGLAPLGAADLLEGMRRGLGELVDVGPGTRSGRPRGDGGHDLGVGDRGDAGDGVHDRDGRLTAAGDHIQVDLADVLMQVHRRTDKRSDGGRSEVDGGDTGRGVERGVRLMRLRRGGFEHKIRLPVMVEKPGDSVRAGLDTH